MHPTALRNADFFFKTYLKRDAAGVRVVDIGSQDVNGSMRSVCPRGVEYVGVDFVVGDGVDVVLADPYKLPFEENSVDFCVSSSVFEHAENFWVLFIEILRILKPQGLFYLNAPSNGQFHRFPVDCWRFYPDSGTALVSWAKRCNLNAALLESYVSLQGNDVWNDFVAVFIKDASCIKRYPARIIDTNKDFYNGLVHGSSKFLHPQEHTEDYLKRPAPRLDGGGVDYFELVQGEPSRVLIIGWTASYSELAAVGIAFGNGVMRRLVAQLIDGVGQDNDSCAVRRMYRFQAHIALGDIPPSTEQIELKSIRSDASEFHITSVPFQPPAIFGNIDRSRSDAADLLIEGWAISAFGSLLIQALDVHGNELARAPTGLIRLDVANAWPAWPDADAAGFLLRVPGGARSGDSIHVVATSRRGDIFDLGVKRPR